MKYNDKKYEKYDIGLDWHTAKLVCEAKGGHLLIVDDKDELNAMSDLLSPSAKEEYWLGISDCLDEGDWVTVLGDKVTFTNWSSGEPSNSFNTEDYAVIRCNLGWNDLKSYSGLYRNTGFICEYEPAKKVKLTLHYMTSTDDTDSFTFDYGEVIDTLPEPYDDNYEFLGWFTKADGGEKIDFPFTITENTELFAHREIINVPSTEPKESVVLGDADGDGEITSVDVTYIQRYNAQMNVGINIDILMNGDVDGNGDLEVTDATYIQRYLALMDTPYPIGEAK